jgi:hypothetical protein
MMLFGIMDHYPITSPPPHFIIPVFNIVYLLSLSCDFSQVFAFFGTRQEVGTAPGSQAVPSWLNSVVASFSSSCRSEKTVGLLLQPTTTQRNKDDNQRNGSAIPAYATDKRNRFQLPTWRLGTSGQGSEANHTEQRFSAFVHHNELCLIVL